MKCPYDFCLWVRSSITEILEVSLWEWDRALLRGITDCIWIWSYKVWKRSFSLCTLLYEAHFQSFQWIQATSDKFNLMQSVSVFDVNCNKSVIQLDLLKLWIKQVLDMEFSFFVLVVSLQKCEVISNLNIQLFFLRISHVAHMYYYCIVNRSFRYLFIEVFPWT